MLGHSRAFRRETNACSVKLKVKLPPFFPRDSLHPGYRRGGLFEDHSTLQRPCADGDSASKGRTQTSIMKKGRGTIAVLRGGKKRKERLSHSDRSRCHGAVARKGDGKQNFVLIGPIRSGNCFFPGAVSFGAFFLSFFSFRSLLVGLAACTAIGAISYPVGRLDSRRNARLGCPSRVISGPWRRFPGRGFSLGIRGRTERAAPLLLAHRSAAAYLEAR